MKSVARAFGAWAVMVVATALIGCAASDRVADNTAEKAGLTRAILEGDGFHHVAYARIEAGAPLLVYPDGDGQPWIHHGRVISADPTVRHSRVRVLHPQQDVERAVEGATAAKARWRFASQVSGVQSMHEQVEVMERIGLGRPGDNLPYPECGKKAAHTGQAQLGRVDRPPWLTPEK
jgi:hypothetical protein